LLLLAPVFLAHCASFGRKLTIAYGEVAAMVAQDQVQIELKRSFIERYKDRVTIDATFTVDAVAERPNPAMFDGDFHFAGRAPEIGLRLVGEILNAESADSAVDRVKQAHASERPIRLTGAWRLWPEHAFGAREQQGRQAGPLPNANPDHVFEIHPVTRADGINLLHTVQPVQGYLPGNPGRTLGIYEDAKYRLEVKPESVVLTVTTGLYNDVHFVAELSREPQRIVGDGRFVYAAALDDTDSTRLVERVRLVFLRNTAAERTIRTMKAGARLHLWGKPRVSFADISRIIRESASNPARLEGPLPYEILVLGVLP
jgi:hypothetical protein